LTKGWADSLEEYPRLAIAGYTGTLYEHINKSLQASPDNLDAMSEGTRHNVRAIDAAIRAYPPHKVLTSYRGVRSRFPEKIAKLEASLTLALEHGTTVKLDGFTSSSLDPFVGIGWGAVTLEIVSPRGAYVGEASERPTEKEILHTHGERFKVKAYRDGKYVLSNGTEIRRKTYTLEAIPELPEPLSPPAAGAEFDFDASKHPKDEQGRWTSVAKDKAASEASDKATSETSPGAESVKATPETLTSVGSVNAPYQAVTKAPESLLVTAEKFVGSLNPWERGHISWYTAENYQQVNTPLRDCPETLDCLPAEDRERAESIDAGIRKFPAHNPPLTSYRGLNTRKLEKWKKLEAGFREALTTGKPIKMNGFSSATLDPVKAFGWGRAVLEIRSPRGAYINSISKHPTELEVLHTHGEQYIVKAIEERHFKDPQSDKVYVRQTIVLEAVPEPPPPIRKPAAFDFNDAVGFREFDPELHPKDEHGRWAKVKAQESAGSVVSPPTPSTPTPAVESGFLVARSESQVPSHIIEAGDKWVKSLSTAESKALSAYTDKNFKGINSALRLHPDVNDPALGARVRKWAKLLSESLDKAPSLDKPLTSYRGVACSTQAKQLAVKSAFTQARLAGATITLNGFSSATLDPSLASTWVAKRKEDGFVLEIKSKRGVYIASGSENPQELEVLHNHGGQYRVTGVRTVEYREQGKTHWPKLTTFTLEHVEDEPAEDAAKDQAMTVTRIADGARVTETELLKELFSRPVVADGIRGDCLLPLQPAKFASTVIPDGAIRVNCPKLSQNDDYTCGVVLLEAFARLFNVAPDDTEVDVREWFKSKLKPSKEYGTSPSSLFELADELDLQPTVYHPMSVAQVKTALNAGCPVMCCVQAWGDSDDYSRAGSGHYIGAIGYDRYRVYFEDPVLKRGRGFMTWGQFVDRWHDVGGDGNEYRQWGMTLWHDEPAATEIE